MIEAIKNALISSLVSALISGIGIYYLHAYLDGKRKENDTRAAQCQEQRRKMDILDQRLRRAEGRLLFWLRDAVDNGREHANGDLTKAWEDFEAAEEARKQYEQELLAEHTDQALLGDG